MGSCYESIPGVALSGPSSIPQAQDLQTLMDQDARTKIFWLMNVEAHASYPSRDNRAYLKTLIPAIPETSQVDPAMQEVIEAFHNSASGTFDFALREKARLAINALFPRLSSPMTVQLAH